MKKADIKRWESAIALIEKAKVKLEFTADNAFMQDTEFVTTEITVTTFLNNEIKDIGLEIHALKSALNRIKENQEGGEG